MKYATNFWDHKKFQLFCSLNRRRCGRPPFLLGFQTHHFRFFFFELRSRGGLIGGAVYGASFGVRGLNPPPPPRKPREAAHEAPPRELVPEIEIPDGRLCYTFQPLGGSVHPISSHDCITHDTIWTAKIISRTHLGHPSTSNRTRQNTVGNVIVSQNMQLFWCQEGGH